MLIKHCLSIDYEKAYSKLILFNYLIIGRSVISTQEKSLLDVTYIKRDLPRLGDPVISTEGRPEKSFSGVLQKISPCVEMTDINLKCLSSIKHKLPTTLPASLPLPGV